MAPHEVDPFLYTKDHEEAYLRATEVFYPFIEESDLVVVYAPNGIGEHTGRDLDHAIEYEVPYIIYPLEEHHDYRIEQLRNILREIDKQCLRWKKIVPAENCIKEIEKILLKVDY